MSNATIESSATNRSQEAQKRQAEERKQQVQENMNKAQEQQFRLVKDQTQEALQTSEEAVTKVVQVYSNAVQSFVPAAVFRPGEALGFVFDIAQQALTIQRRFWLEVLGAVQENVSQVDQQLSRDSELTKSA